MIESGSDIISTGEEQWILHTFHLVCPGHQLAERTGRTA